MIASGLESFLFGRFAMGRIFPDIFSALQVSVACGNTLQGLLIRGSIHLSHVSEGATFRVLRSKEKGTLTWAVVKSCAERNE